MLSAFPDMVPQRHGADTVLTGVLDRPALYVDPARRDRGGLVLIS